MLIGELAGRTGTSARALRHYEKRGLVQAERAGNGYRVYDAAELPVVEEIRTLLTAGFVLEDIGPFVACLRAGRSSSKPCRDSVNSLRHKLDEVADALAQLTAVQSELQDRLATAEAALPPTPACEMS
jgi:DNA-binding transcriptional MerR regulator